MSGTVRWERKRAYLGGDEGRETALLEEAHLDGCGLISTNWRVPACPFAPGDVPGRARRWGGDGGRAVGGEVREESCKADYAGAFRQATTPASSHRHHRH